MSVAEPQWRSALDRANASRLAGARVKRDVAAGRTTVARALVDPAAQSLTVFELLCAQRRWGRARTLRALAFLRDDAEVWLSERKRVRDLTDRQRRALADALTDRARASC